MLVCGLLQVITAETLMDPSDLSDNDQAPSAGEVSKASHVRHFTGLTRPVDPCYRGQPPVCCFLARVSGWRMWIGTALPTGIPVSSPASISTPSKSNCVQQGIPRGQGKGGLGLAEVDQVPFYP
jgi:hypothetical protein